MAGARWVGFGYMGWISRFFGAGFDDTLVSEQA